MNLLYDSSFAFTFGNVAFNGFRTTATGIYLICQDRIMGNVGGTRLSLPQIDLMPLSVLKQAVFTPFR